MRASQKKLEEFDPDTGKMRFKPTIINRSPNLRERPVWIDLFEISKKQTSSRENSPQRVLINKNSQQITEKIRYKQYKTIFECLGPINGKITYGNIDLNNNDQKMIEILNPLLQELAESDIVLDFSQFCQAIDALIKVLTPQEKWYLIFSFNKPKPV